MNMDYVADALASNKLPVQLVKHFDEVLEKNIHYPLIGQLKYDGIYCLLVCIGTERRMFSRVGKALYFEGIESFMGGCVSKLRDGVYIGELCSDAVTLEQLSGLVSPNRKKPWSEQDYTNVNTHGYIAFHDYLTTAELLDGHSTTSYTERWDRLHAHTHSAQLLDYLEAGEFIANREQAEAYADVLINSGMEGAVFKDPNADWVAGHKGYRAMKRVRGISMDLRCVGVIFGKGKRAGQIAALRFTMNGNEFNADLGKGWTDERRIELTNDYINYDHPDAHEKSKIVGQIWELKALQMSSTGKALRLPKVVRVRWDKETPDA